MVDQKKVQEAIKLLLEGIGEDTDREGLKETPERIGRMYEEICGGMDQDAGEHLSKVFSVDNNEMVTNLLFLNLSSFGCLHEKWSILLLPILFLLFFVDSENENASVKIKFTTRISCGLVLFMVIGLIWVALYLGFTPVGSDYITGVQARYYLPILMLGAYICWNNKIISRMNSLVYNRIIFTGIAWLLFQCIYKLCLVPHYL